MAPAYAAALVGKLKLIEDEIVEAQRRGNAAHVASLLSEREGILASLEREREKVQARKEGARPTKCRHGVSMADDCRACREALSQQKAVEQKREQVERNLRLYQGIERLKAQRFTPAAQEQARLEWTPIFAGEADSLDYQGIARSSELAEYWNQTKPKPGELADALDRSGLGDAQVENPGRLREVYAAQVNAPMVDYRNYYAQFFDDAKVRRLQEDAAAAQAKQMVNQRMARYVAMRQDLEMQLGAVMQGQSQPRVQVRRAPATVAPGPPMEAKRGYFDE